MAVRLKAKGKGPHVASRYLASEKPLLSGERNSSKVDGETGEKISLSVGGGEKPAREKNVQFSGYR